MDGRDQATTLLFISRKHSLTEVRVALHSQLGKKLFPAWE